VIFLKGKDVTIKIVSGDKNMNFLLATTLSLLCEKHIDSMLQIKLKKVNIKEPCFRFIFGFLNGQIKPLKGAKAEEVVLRWGKKSRC
jgi:hypothetical protein